MYAFNDSWLDRGTCHLCGKTYKATAFTSHLHACIPRTLGLKPVELDTGATAGVRKARYLMLNVSAYGSRDYWLYLGVQTDATLSELDGFLRELWLECCGHMSAFSIQETSYESSSWGFDDPWADSRSMDVALGKVLPHKTRGNYTYDFGSSTELYIESKKLYSVPDNRRDPDRIRVLARNIAPEFVCDTCGKPASFLQWDEEDMWEQHHYCNSHQPEEEDFVYPLVNSPRCGVCDYRG